MLGTEQKLLGIGEPKRGILCQLKLESLNLLENSNNKKKVETSRVHM